MRRKAHPFPQEHKHGVHSMSNKKAPNTTLIVRIVAFILAFLMIAGVAYYVVASILVSVSANDIKLDDYKISGDTKKNIYVACGLHFGDDPEVCPTPRSANGFIIGEAYVDSQKREFYPYIVADEAKEILVAQISHLKLSEGLYIPCAESEATILPYRVEISSSSKDIWAMQEDINKTLGVDENMFCAKAVSLGKKALRYGSFTDATSASVYAGEVGALIAEKYSGIDVNISIPTGTGVCFINKTNGKVLFEYDNGGDFTYAPAIYPISNSDGSQTGTTLASGMTYFDAILFLRDGNMINTTNLVALDTYIQGVLPSEIYSTWPIEVQKAFAIIVRSYTLSVLCGKHYSNYHVDMCATACCQAYKGRANINELVIEAANSTKDRIMTYNGSLVTTYYAAVHGGESISNNHAWGGSARGYLPSQKTPWEKYTTYTKNRGVWFAEFTPQELADQLRSKGYTAIKKPIASVTVNERAGNTNYVYKTTYTDTAGNSVTITRTSKNYSALGLKCANFNIAQNSVDYYLDHVLSVNIERTTAENSNPLMSLFDVITGNGIFSINSASAKVNTANGVFGLSNGANFALTAEGLKQLPQYEFELSTPDENGYYKAINVYEDTVITTFLKRENMKYEASKEGNFVIAGKGWGHGIGLSQYGANDLAQVGAEYDQIIKAYYPNTKIITIDEYFS